MYYHIHTHIENKYFEELKNLSAPMRESMIFKYVTEEMPLYIKPEDVFAGWYEFEESTVRDENCVFPFVPVLDETERALHKDLRDNAKTEVRLDRAHSCMNYGAVIKKGLISYIEQVEAELAKEPENEFLKAMLHSLRAAGAYSLRYAKIAEELAQKEEDEQKKTHYRKMHEALCQVPMYPARDFYEAVQSLWLVHTLTPMAEKGWYSISVGRADQFLYEYYQKAMADGWSVEEIKDILKQLFLLLDSYGDGACTVNIGGMDMDGNDMMNELSEILIQVEKEVHLRAPILAVRVNPNTSDEILDSLIDFDLFKIGQPTFYGELPCRKAVMEREIAEEEAAGFSANSCMGLIMSGSEFASMWAVKLNTHLALELAVNYGKPFHCDLPYETKVQPREISNLEELLAQYQLYLKELIDVCADMYIKVAKEEEVNGPVPFVSALLEGCVEKRGDRSTSAKYNTMTVECMGLVNTCDAMEAIRELVFEQKKYTLEELIQASINNFAGEEAKILHDLRKCKKYGMNDEHVNEICQKVTGFTAQACKANRRENMIFAPSLHTIDVNVWWGSMMYATLDGRKNGEPVNKNANPSHLLQKADHTSHILSAAAFDQSVFHGGQPIDLYFDKSWFATKESRDKIKQLIRTYFALGGLQFQVNSVDIELLEKAHKEPEKYSHVIVRKGGFSVWFTDLDAATRKDFIEQAKKLEG